MGTKKDLINPDHYKRGGMEAIDVIRAFDLDYLLGNAVKYLLRAGHKDDLLTDLKKARWYIDRKIAELDKPETPTEQSSTVLAWEVGGLRAMIRKQTKNLYVGYIFIPNAHVLRGVSSEATPKFLGYDGGIMYNGITEYGHAIVIAQPCELDIIKLRNTMNEMAERISSIRITDA